MFQKIKYFEEYIEEILKDDNGDFLREIFGYYKEYMTVNDKTEVDKQYFYYKSFLEAYRKQFEDLKARSLHDNSPDWDIKEIDFSINHMIKKLNSEIFTLLDLITKACLNSTREILGE